MIDSIINTTTSHPVYLAILGVIVILLAYAVIKKVIKLIFSVGVLLIMYVIYLNYTGQDVPETSEEFKKSVSDTFQKGEKKLSELKDDIKNTATKSIQEKVDKGLEKLIKD